jgi:hypothetical protein
LTLDPTTARIAPMKRALAIFSLVGLVSVLFAFTPADAAHKRRRRHTTKRYNVTLTVHYGVNMIQGAINSEREECVEDREVELFRDGTFIGRVTTDRYGAYQKPEPTQGERYTASVDSMTFEDTRQVTRICEAAVARTPTP